MVDNTTDQIERTNAAIEKRRDTFIRTLGTLVGVLELQSPRYGDVLSRMEIARFDMATQSLRRLHTEMINPLAKYKPDDVQLDHDDAHLNRDWITDDRQ